MTSPLNPRLQVPLAESPFAAALDSARSIDEVVALPPLDDVRREWRRSAELLEERKHYGLAAMRYA